MVPRRRHPPVRPQRRRRLGPPLYSPVDGDIVACFRRLPDDNEDGSEPAACPGTSGASNRCVAGGNHVVIRTTDGHLISLNHFRQDSIPAALCPITDTMLFDDDPKVCSLFGWNAALREGARLDNRSIAPIPVRKGEFVGRVGLSGNTNGVHLHMGVSEFTTDPAGNYCSRKSASEFREGWSQVRTPGSRPTRATGIGCRAPSCRSTAPPISCCGRTRSASGSTSCRSSRARCRRWR
ncbi:hypothetical protein [Nannocystis pusilla]|uniref:hypothetical protein n=1 Tax=Nannocystis pusilla TaxID=889268 RepID=UPI003B7F3668